MNNDEAKFVLHGYRPNGADAADPALAAALEQAARDPGLGQWLRAQQTFDTEIATKLGQVMPPPDLRAAILAGAQVTVDGQGSRRSWVRPAWLAAAASIAVIFAGGLFWWPKEAHALDEFAYRDAQLGPAHGHGGGSRAPHSLQWNLSQKTTKLGDKIPVDFVALKSGGCRVVRFAGRDVLEVCFNRDGQWFHCYVARAPDFPEMAMPTVPRIHDHGDSSLASWTDGENLFIVVSKTGRATLEALL